MSWYKIRDSVLSKPYRYYFLIFFLGYLVLNFFVNDISKSKEILTSTNIGNFVIFSMILIALLVSISINLVIMKFREIRRLNRAGGFAALGMFGGLLGSACPACFIGLFPAFLGLFGITASLTDLPFNGLELQISSILLLIISLFLLTRDSTCSINK